MHGVQSIRSPTGPYVCDCGQESATREAHEAHEAAATGRRDPREQQTLKDALDIATSIVEEEGDDARRTKVQSDRFTLAAGFLVLAGDMAAMLDAARKATHFCGWCERANGDSRMGLVAMPLEEIRAHTLQCEHNPLVVERGNLRVDVEALSRRLDEVRGELRDVRQERDELSDATYREGRP